MKSIIKLPILFVVLGMSVSHAQEFAGYYVLQNSNEKIECIFDLKPSNDNKTRANTIPSRKMLNLADHEGFKRLSPHGVARFVIQYGTNNEQEFESIKVYHQRLFAEKISSGIIALYKDHFIHAHDGSSFYQYIIKMKGKPEMIVDRAGFKADILDYVQNDKYIKKKLRRAKYKDIETIITAYNEKFLRRLK